MVERWNDLVADDDDVWVIGDIALGDLHAMLTGHVARLRGRKVLVPGNHDRCWAGRDKHNKSRRLYLELRGGSSGSSMRPSRCGSAARRCASATSRTCWMGPMTSSTSITGPATTAAGCCTATSTKNGANEAARST